MKKVLFILTLLTVVYSCKKAEVPAIPVKLDFITSEVSKDWYIQNVAITTTINGADRQLNVLLECESDDIWKFYRDGRLLVQDNLSKCQGTPDERLNTSWAADDTYDNIVFNNWRIKGAEDLTNVEFAITNLSDSTMTLTAGGVIPNTKAVTINYRTL